MSKRRRCPATALILRRVGRMIDMRMRATNRESATHGLPGRSLAFLEPIPKSVARVWNPCSSPVENRCHRGLWDRLLALAIPICAVLLAGAVQAEPGIERDLRTALSSIPHAEVMLGACVIDLDSGETVFAKGADKPLIPASSAKVFVMVAALMQLGPGFSFETLLAKHSNNLVVIGDGDPAVGDAKLHRAKKESITADFERWADTLLDRGILKIPGDLVIDESIFDDARVHPSWEESDLDNWYAAPVGGLNFNDNCIDITIFPAATTGAPVRVSFLPENDLVKIVNKCRTGGGGKPILHHAYDTFEYRLSGKCGKRWPFGSVSFPDPGLLFAESLRTVLKRKGIELSGRIRRERVREADGSLPSSLTILGRRKTPLPDVLKRTGKDSQNLFADCLLKRVGYEWAKRSGVQDPKGSWPTGGKAVVETVELAGIECEGLVVADGSGLSRDNTCTARQLAALLTWIQKQPEGQLMLDSLSIAGANGSLRGRLADIRGRVHAKTGTMRGVSALAGYVCGGASCGLGDRKTTSNISHAPRQPENVATSSTQVPLRALPRERETPDQRSRSADDHGEPRYAFAILFNGYTGPAAPYKKIQDRFCRILARAATEVAGGEKMKRDMR